MLDFEVYDETTAPEGSRDALRQVKAKYGFAPNLFGVLALSPALLRSYVTLSEQLDKSSFSAAERQVILLSVSHENACHYCMAAHSTVAAMSGVPQEVIEALRAASELPDAKLEALRSFTLAVMRNRGRLKDQDITAFLDAGFTKTQVLEVLVGVAMKTISNYTNHIADTPLDDAFKAKAWHQARQEMNQS